MCLVETCYYGHLFKGRLLDGVTDSHYAYLLKDRLLPKAITCGKAMAGAGSWRDQRKKEQRCKISGGVQHVTKVGTRLHLVLLCPIINESTGARGGGGFSSPVCRGLSRYARIWTCLPPLSIFYRSQVELCRIPLAPGIGWHLSRSLNEPWP